MKKTILNIAACVFAITSIMAQQTPAPKQSKSILIMNATAHLGNGEVIENSLIGFKDGKLSLVADATTSKLDQQAYDEIIEAAGKHVYPGFIACNATLGLVEIDAVRATDDEDEIGGMIPNIRSLIAYNAESQIVESMRPNGVLMAQITPRGGRISGTSSVVQLDAWNWEDAAIKVDDAIHLNWPNSFTRGRWWLGEDPGMKPNKKYPEDLDDVVSFINEAKAYLKGDQTPRNLPYEALSGLINGTQKLYIHVDGEKEILDAINFSQENNIKIVIVGGRESYKVADMLAENNIPVLVGRPHSLPAGEDTNVKQPYKLAALLTEKGVLVSIDPSGSMERMNTRNLPFYAGTFAAYGLNKEQAIALLTLNAAKILGIDDLAGSLEIGKDATLFISEGDALDMRTNKLSKAFIQGRDISLESHQTELYHRYNSKINGK